MAMVFPITVAARVLIILVKGGVEVATSPWVLQHIVDVSRCNDLLHDNLNYTKWLGGSINLSLRTKFFSLCPNLKPYAVILLYSKEAVVSYLERR